MSIPFVGSLFSKWKTRDFSGEMGSLLQSGLSMQDALEVLVEQEADPILSEIAYDDKRTCHLWGKFRYGYPTRQPVFERN